MSARSTLLHLARARDERGFGMIEMLTALTVLLVGVMAVFAMFQSGLVQLTRASTVTTAGALADAEMEGFRAIRFDRLGIDPTATTDSTYTTDTAYAADTSPTTTVSGGISASATTLVVTSATGFPNAEFRLKIDTEILIVTAVSGTSWTVVRGAEGTAAAAHSAGATVTLKRRVDVPSCASSSPPCTDIVPTKTEVGADGKSYRVDTFVTWTQVTSQAGTASRGLKQITLVVRDAAAPYREWARVVSTFDEATGI